jgi:hypothetical protein
MDDGELVYDPCGEYYNLGYIDYSDNFLSSFEHEEYISLRERLNLEKEESSPLIEMLKERHHIPKNKRILLN